MRDAKVFSQQGQLKSSEKSLLESIRHEPKNSDAYQQLAEFYIEQGDSKRAIDQLNRAVEADCGCPQIHTRLGELYLQSGQLLSAKRHSEIALESTSILTEPWVLAGDIAGAQGEWSESLAAYHRALDCGGSELTVSLKICELYSKTNRPLRALSTMERLLADYPEHLAPQEALVAHGTLLTEMKNYHKAIEQLERAVAREAAPPEAYLRLSNALLLSGQVDQARRTLSVAQGEFPDLPVFGDLLRQSGVSEDERLTELKRDFE